MIARLQNRYNRSIHQRSASSSKAKVRDNKDKHREVGDGLLLPSRKRRPLRLLPIIHILTMVLPVWDLIQVRVLMVMVKAKAHRDPPLKVFLSIHRSKVISNKDTLNKAIISKGTKINNHSNRSIILTISHSLLKPCLRAVAQLESALMVLK